MKQILHISSKDVRRLWIEILLAVAAAALLAWMIPKTWNGGPIFPESPYKGIGILLFLLVPLSWFLLIARLIHGEVLVGDRQFWITRPYEWPKLLAAKALFVAVFLYLPFLLVQASVLLRAGFNPLSYIPGLACRLLLISLVFFPLIGLAAITSNLVRMVLTMLGAFVAFGALMSLAIFSHLAVVSHGDNGPVTYDYSPYGKPTALAVTLLVCGAVVVVQYARRRVLVARLLLGSMPFLVLLAVYICNLYATMDRIFPPAARTDASMIRMIPFDQDEARRDAASRWSENEHSNYYNIDTKKWATIKVELRASGVKAGGRWQLDAFRPTLTPAHGAPLKLDWQQGQEVFEATDAPNRLSYSIIPFLIPRAEYERLKSSPLTLHLDLAFTQATPAWSQRFAIPKGDFMIPGFASCTTIEDRNGETPRIFALNCRYPLRMPAVTTVTALLTKGPCSAAPTPADGPELKTSNSLGDFGNAPASLGLSPMEERGLLIGPDSNSNNGKPLADSEVSRLCPGTPVVVTQYRKVRSVQTGVAIENFSLAAQ